MHVVLATCPDLGLSPKYAILPATDMTGVRLVGLRGESEADGRWDGSIVEL